MSTEGGYGKHHKREDFEGAEAMRKLGAEQEQPPGPPRPELLGQRVDLSSFPFDIEVAVRRSSGEVEHGWHVVGISDDREKVRVSKVEEALSEDPGRPGVLFKEIPTSELAAEQPRFEPGSYVILPTGENGNFEHWTVQQQYPDGRVELAHERNQTRRTQTMGASVLFRLQSLA